MVSEDRSFGIQVSCHYTVPRVVLAVEKDACWLETGVTDFSEYEPLVPKSIQSAHLSVHLPGDPAQLRALASALNEAAATIAATLIEREEKKADGGAQNDPGR